ncbi:response regulator transcription factor [Paenibacillus gorillae]|uniref:response regulator transcription factor n=1 Tax=Paenibacillus gorillae TaxID=1243662 RepID=UPI0004B8BD3A|nr:helix-turn-helix domain-containing protein [Paenibacillus gorillae]
MHRLMIVDDERHIVDWLYDLFMDQLDMDLDIIKAYSGKEALQNLECAKIDIVLSDIRMPGMSGLELMGKIKDSWPGCKIVFLTGFNDFEYIYSAVKQNGVSYLLKTEDDDEIVDTVKQAISSLEQELGNRQLRSRVLEREELVSHLLRKELLLDVIGGKVRLADADRGWLDKLDIPFDENRPVLLLFGRVHGGIVSQDYSERFLSLRGLSSLTGQYVAPFASHVLIDIGKYDLLWLIQPVKRMEEDADAVYESDEQLWRRTMLFVKGNLETLQAASEEALETKISFLLYDQPVAWSSVQESWDLLKAMADMRIHSPRGMPVVCSIDAEAVSAFDAANKAALDGSAYARKTEALQDCLEQGLRKEFFEKLDEVDKGLSAVTRMRDLSASQVYGTISLLFLTYINKHRLADKLHDRIPLGRLIPATGFDSWRESFDYLRELGHAVFALKEDEQTSREGELIERIIAFVRGNLHGELTLIRISEKVNYNPSYVSRLFKQETGTNLFDYINKARIGKAKELLEDGTRPIQDIARAVGFDSPQYFATAFKKMTGKTPNEYRNQLI